MLDVNILEAEEEAKRFLKKVEDYKNSDSYIANSNG